MHSRLWAGLQGGAARFPGKRSRLTSERRGRDTPQLWVGHSWGGVLLLSVLARFPEYRKLVSGVVLFGTKRSVYGLNFEKLVKLEFFWHRAARVLRGLHGYLPAARYGVG